MQDFEPADDDAVIVHFFDFFTSGMDNVAVLDLPAGTTTVTEPPALDVTFTFNATLLLLVTVTGTWHMFLAFALTDDGHDTKMPPLAVALLSLLFFFVLDPALAFASCSSASNASLLRHNTKSSRRSS